MLTQESAARKDRTTGRSATLQHRHFAFIAETIAVMYVPKEERRVVALHFADACAGSNPRFDRARFLTACGVEE